MLNNFVYIAIVLYYNIYSILKEVKQMERRKKRNKDMRSVVRYVYKSSKLLLFFTSAAYISTLVIFMALTGYDPKFIMGITLGAVVSIFWTLTQTTIMKITNDVSTDIINYVREVDCDICKKASTEDIEIKIDKQDSK